MILPYHKSDLIIEHNFPLLSHFQYDDGLDWLAWFWEETGWGDGTRWLFVQTDHYNLFLHNEITLNDLFLNSKEAFFITCNYWDMVDYDALPGYWGRNRKGRNKQYVKIHTLDGSHYFPQPELFLKDLI